MKSIHLILHVSQLELATLNMISNHVQTPPPPVDINDEIEYKIKETLNSKIDCQHWNCKLLYLIHWSSYKCTGEEAFWLLTDELRHASKLVHEFHPQYPDKSGPHPT